MKCNDLLVACYTDIGRSPCGERGLKLLSGEPVRTHHWSLPVRGAWIEIFLLSASRRLKPCRSPCGERGLKFLCLLIG